MTLLQSITRDAPGDETDALVATLKARLAFLNARAEGLQQTERAPPMAVATLWIDACETASFLGEATAARRALRAAARALTRAGNPFGDTLRIAFFGRSQPSVQALEDAGDILQTEGAAQAWAIFNSAQRQPWEGGSARSLGRTSGAQRFGRLGWTQDELLSVATAGREQRQAFFATHLMAQFHALRNAQRNTDLWRRQLAPVALFDLELAVLIRHGLADRWGEVNSGWTAETVADAEPREFMRAYLDGVAALIQPEAGNDLPLRVELRL